jgi:hypothetical protein
MTRLEHMRLYRSHLVNEVNALVDKYLAKPQATDLAVLHERVRTMQNRVLTMNVEIDKQMAIQLGRKDAQKEVEFASA